MSLAILLVALPACPSKTDAPAPARLELLQQVEVTDRSRPDDRVPGVDADAVAGWVTARLRASKAITLVSKPGPGVYRLGVELGVGKRDGKPVLLVSARAEVPGDLERVILQASLVRTPDSVDAAQMRKAVETAVEDILFQAKLAVAGEREVVQALERPRDVQRLAAAVEIVAVRQVKAAVPPLIKLLRHKDASIADRAIGALAAIGDQRAVRPLTRLTKFYNTEKMAKVIDAIATLGGQEAKDYLEFVASGHDDADIRNLASEALQRMRRKGQAKQSK